MATICFVKEISTPEMSFLPNKLKQMQ